VRWRRWHWIAAGGLALGSMIAASDAWLDAARLAVKDEEVGYVLLAPFVVSLLVWVRRHRLVYCRSGGAWIGVILAALGWWLWSSGYRCSAPTLWHLGPVLLLAGAIVSVVGRDMLLKFLPAFVALLFLVPITPTRRQIVAAPMEEYAAIWTQQACELVGLNVVRHGNLLSTNGTEVEVAEACSGIRLVVSFGLVAYVLAFARPLRWQFRAFILLAVPIVAISSNVVRLVPTVWMYSHGATAAAASFHDVAGWIMLFLAFAALGGAVAALDWAMGPIRRVSLQPS
jgi:exosortase